MTSFHIVCIIVLRSKDDHYPKKDWISFNMRSARRFNLMVNQILINAEDRMGFQQNMERLSLEETAFSIYIQLVKLIFGEEPLHTRRENRLDMKVESQNYEN